MPQEFAITGVFRTLTLKGRESGRPPPVLKTSERLFIQMRIVHRTF